MGTTTGKATSFITFSRGTLATVTDSDGKIKWAAHNFVLNSASPVTQNITTIVGAKYKVEMTGSGSVALSGAGSGTVTTGVSVEITASTTTLTLTCSGTVSTMWAYRSDLGGMQLNGAGTTYNASTGSAYHGPRLDYDPVTRSAKGLLVEESRVNLLQRSAGFDNAVWDNGAPNSATVATDAVSPDGTLTGQTLTAATGGTSSVRRQSVSIAGATTYTFSLFIKQGTATSSRILVRDDTNGSNFIQATAITWSAGVPSIGGTTGTWATPVSVGNGWYRISGTAAAGAGATITVLAGVFPDNAAGTGTLLVYGAQLEAGSFATSYIPTAASTVTRNADVTSVGTSQFPYSATEGTLVISFGDLDFAGTISGKPPYDAAIGLVTNGLRGGRQFTLQNSNGWRVQNKTGTPTASSVFSGSSALAPVNGAAVAHKVAAAINASEMAGVVNGGAVTTTAITVAPTGTPDLFYINPQMNGHVRQITYLPRKLTSAELQSRTA